MVIISTFNEDMYNATGKGMLESVEKFLPDSKKVIYGELTNVELNYETIDVCQIDQFKTVFDQNKDVITENFGGTAKKVSGDKSWNIRWFGWFRKVVMNYHAICETGYDDYVIFVDSDIRIIKPFTEEFLKEITTGKAISYFKGTRPAIDSGFVVVNARDPNAAKFYNKFMNIFLNKEFKKLPRWDDGYVLTRIVENTPKEWTYDFAHKKAPKVYKNTTGYVTGGQIIPKTIWKEYIEHDKGIHWKKDIVPHRGMHDPGHKPKTKA